MGELPTAQYKLDICDPGLQFDDSPETEIAEVTNESKREEAGEEWYTGWDAEDGKPL